MNIETASVQAFSEIFPETVLDQRFDEALAIRIIHEDQFAPVTAIHDVINRASILDSQLADQTGEWLWPLYVSISRTDPFFDPFSTCINIKNRPLFDPFLFAQDSCSRLRCGTTSSSGAKSPATSAPPRASAPETGPLIF